jgi:hypothetical protein
MKHSQAARVGFSLVEVAITLGVVAFAFFGLLGLFPVALEQSKSCVNETRGAQLARMVFSTLARESFTSAECFGDTGAPPLDLSSLDAGSPPVVLYASYNGTGEPAILRTETAPADATYRMELHFNLATSPGISPTKARGNSIRFLMTGGSLGQTIAFQSVDFISGLQHVAAVQ